MLQSKVSWKDGMAFEAELEGFRFGIDADPEFGGRGLGPRPKGLLLTALAGCTAMDVVAILGKMRLQPTRLQVSADGELADDHPKRYTTIVLRYEVEGELPPNKVDRAVRLSEERYCGVRTSLGPDVRVDSEIWLNGERLERAPAD
jgi:putative redox protein